MRRTEGCGGAEVPRNAEQGVFRGIVTVHRGPLGGTSHVGIVVGASHGGVDHPDPGLLEQAGRRDRFRQVLPQRIVHIHAESGEVRYGVRRTGHPRSGIRVSGIRDTVVYVHPGSQRQFVLRFFANASDHVPDQPRPVLETPAVSAFPEPRGQEFGEQVAMALLDVYEVEPQFPGQDRGIHEGIFHPAEFGVRQHRVVRGNRYLALLVHEGNRIGGGIVKGDQRFPVTVPARVGQLQPDHEVVIAAMDGPVGLAGLREQCFEGRGVALVKPELAGIRPGFLRHGRGLAPDQFGAALAEEPPPAEYQFVG